MPRVQVVLTPPTPNLEIPNEDARSVDLEDSNLFALNRFPGYDRWEDASRVTYGVDWSLERKIYRSAALLGKATGSTSGASIFPVGTGLTGRISDIVGRTRIRYGRLIDITHRYRIDKNSFAIRRNEVDLTVGTNQTYVQVGYLRLNRDIDPAIEDLRDKEELRVAGAHPVPSLLVDFRRNRDRPHRPQRGSAFARGRLAAGAQPHRHSI